MIEILILLILANYGVTQILVESRIFKPLRRILPGTIINTLLNCFLCVSVWFGFLISLFVYSISANMLLVFNIPLAIFVDGMILSAGAWLLHALENKLTTQ